MSSATTSPAASIPRAPRHDPRVLFRFLMEPYRFFRDLHARYGDVFSVAFPGVGEVIFVGDPELVHAVFERDREGRFEVRDSGFLEPIAGPRSILVTNDALHESQRRLLLPSFHGPNLAAHLAPMQDAARRAASRWVPGVPLVAQDAFVEITVDVVTRLILGDIGEARAAGFRDRLREMLDALPPPLLFIKALRINLGRRSPWGRFLESAARFNDVLRLEMADRRRAPRGQGMIELLLAARTEDGAPLDDGELRDHLVTLFVLGHESTVAALTWGMTMLLDDARVMAAIRGELAAAGERPDAATLDRLPYLDAVCREILRLAPPVPEVRRRYATAPLRLGPYSIPAGVYVSPSVFLVHRHASLYPDPEGFRPERFLERKFQQHQFMPFGGGARGCIGGVFALSEMKIVLGTLFERFDLHLSGRHRTRRQNLSVAPKGVEFIPTRARSAPSLSRAS